MRRIHLAFLLASALALAVPASVFAIEGDRVDGRGVDSGGAKFTFTSDATGALDRANGGMRYIITNNDPDRRIVGNVTCQRIIGNTATVGGVITGDNAGGTLVGSPFNLFVNDEAKPGDGLDDFLFTTTGAPGTPPVCQAPFQFEINIRDGDIVIDPA
jgi:hypothetical protein